MDTQNRHCCHYLDKAQSYVAGNVAQKLAKTMHKTICYCWKLSSRRV